MFKHESVPFSSVKSRHTEALLNNVREFSSISVYVRKIYLSSMLSFPIQKITGSINKSFGLKMKFFKFY